MVTLDTLSDQKEIIHIIGGSEEIEFHFDEDTSVLESCSLVIENRMFILGGVFDEGKVPGDADFCHSSTTRVPINRHKSVL